jgi:hypothetical protein
MIATLKFENEDGLICPYFQCGSCGGRVTGPANVIYDSDARGNYTGCAVYHKGRCDPRNDKAWEELHELLLQLVGNSRVPASRLRELADAIEDDGDE